MSLQCIALRHCSWSRKCCHYWQTDPGGEIFSQSTADVKSIFDVRWWSHQLEYYHKAKILQRTTNLVRCKGIKCSVEIKEQLRDTVFLSITVKQGSVSRREPGARKVETNQSKLQTIWEMPSGRPDLLLSDFLFHVAGAFRGPVELSVVFSGCPFERCSGLEGECNYSWRRISFCVVEHRLCPFAQKAESMILITLRMLTCWTLGSG